MPATSQAQARWARAGCPGSSISPASCSHFVPHGKGSMKALPLRATMKRIVRDRQGRKHG